MTTEAFCPFWAKPGQTVDGGKIWGWIRPWPDNGGTGGVFGWEEIGGLGLGVGQSENGGRGGVWEEGDGLQVIKGRRASSLGW